MSNKNIAGFSLTEIMIALVIVGILASIAIPSYQSSQLRSNRSDGQSALLEAASRMERYFFANNTYTTDLTNISYSASSDVATKEGRYTLKVNAATASCPIATCFVLQATAVGNQASDGNLTINSLGQKLPEDKW